MSGDTTWRWLTAEENPAARSVALRDFAGDPAADLAPARDAALAWAPVQAILARQGPSGAFEPADATRPSAMVTVHALAMLATCGLEARDAPVARAVDFLAGRHRVQGVYSNNTGGSGVLPCYVGQFITVLAALRHPEAGTLAAGSVAWLAAHQRFDDRFERAGGDEPWPFRAPVNYGCWRTVSCYHGLVGALLGLASIPAGARDPLVRERLAQAVAWLRRHHVYKRSAGDRPIFRHMTQFFLHGGYRFHLIDVLEGLSQADPALIHEPWVAAAVADVEALCPEGRVPLVKNYDSHFLDPHPLEAVGAPSRFLTLQWWRTRRNFGLPLPV